MPKPPAMRQSDMNTLDGNEDVSSRSDVESVREEVEDLLASGSAGGETQSKAGSPGKSDKINETV